ncbi:MAG: hypothetical protein WD716_02195 [Fimbriimonadaceae bacterium]
MNEEKNGLKTAPHLQKQDPKDTQFRPGNPGGPGRPKGSIGIKRLIREALWKDGGKQVHKIVDTAIWKADHELAYLKFLLAVLDELAEHDARP